MVWALASQSNLPFTSWAFTGKTFGSIPSNSNRKWDRKWQRGVDFLAHGLNYTHLIIWTFTFKSNHHGSHFQEEIVLIICTLTKHVTQEHNNDDNLQQHHNKNNMTTMKTCNSTTTTCNNTTTKTTTSQQWKPATLRRQPANTITTTHQQPENTTAAYRALCSGGAAWFLGTPLGQVEGGAPSWYSPVIGRDSPERGCRRTPSWICATCEPWWQLWVQLPQRTGVGQPCTPGQSPRWEDGHALCKMRVSHINQSLSHDQSSNWSVNHSMHPSVTITQSFSLCTVNQ